MMTSRSVELALRPRPLVAIVDYGLGNLFSVRQACIAAGCEAELTADARGIESADAVVLPGVGAFGDAMAALRALDLVSPLCAAAQEEKPILAICLGMQLLMAESYEFGVHVGLGLIPGTVTRLRTDTGRGKVPHVGWEALHVATGKDWSGSVLDTTSDGELMYFVHSYYAVPADPSVVIAVTPFGSQSFCSCVEQGSITGCQFHPERSGAAGLRLYRNFGMRASMRLKRTI